jgi:hypothetical protein
MSTRPGVPRRFWLVRETPFHTEIVAEGTQSSRGQVVIFDSGIPAIWPDFAALLAASQPGTSVHWLDQDRLLRRSIP